MRTFTGAPPKEGAPAPAAAGRPAEDDEEGAFRAPVARVAVKQGMNRFTWDMRYPNARDFPGLIMWAGSTRGPQAPPGRYTVRLTGQRRDQDAAVRHPPQRRGQDRDGCRPPGAVQARPADQREADRGERERPAHPQPEGPDHRAHGQGDRRARSRRPGQSLTDKLTAIEGEIYQYRNRSSQDPLNFPIRLNNKLAALQGVVESGDGKPTDQSYAVFKDLSERLDKQVAALDALVKTDLPALNKALAGKKLEPIKDGVPPAPSES